MKLLKNLLILFIPIISNLGCKSENITMQEYDVVEEVYLDINQEFVYELGTGISIEGGYSIKTQASNFKISEIQLINIGGLKQQYIYQPKTNYNGDAVVILQNCISIGSADCNKIELFKFVFHIK